MTDAQQPLTDGTDEEPPQLGDASAVVLDDGKAADWLAVGEETYVVSAEAVTDAIGSANASSGIASAVASVVISSAVAVASSTLSATATPALDAAKPAVTEGVQTASSWSALSVSYYLFLYVPYHAFVQGFDFFRLFTTTTLTFTLSYWSILVTVLVLAVGAYIFLRYRVLTRYSRLPKVSQPVSTKMGDVVGAPFDLHPDAALDDGYGREDASAYPDEFMGAFLASIKVFGYLDRPVFHEIVRHLQTRKIAAGEILERTEEQDRDFYVVVEGTVRVYIKAPGTLDSGFDTYTSLNDDDEREADDNGKVWPGHHLLNEVRPGGSVSSMFAILSVFTDDLQEPQQRNAGDQDQEFDETPTRDGADVPMTGTPEMAVDNDASPRDGGSPVLNDGVNGMNGHNATGNAGSDGMSMTPPPIHDSPPKGPGMGRGSGRRLLHSNIVVRATTDATVAVIPAEAFRKLTEKFPNAAAHIAQVILTRFHRVTFLTLYRYLGLSKELLKIEKQVNEFAGYGLPTDFFEPGGLERLKQRHETMRTVDDTVTDTEANGGGGSQPPGNANRAARAKSPPRSPNGVPKKRVGNGKPSKSRRNDDHYEADVDDSEKELGRYGVGMLARGIPNSHDYHAHVPHWQQPSHGNASHLSLGRPPVPLPPGGLRTSNLVDMDSEEDLNLKESILDCISALIGMVPSQVKPSPKVTPRPSMSISDILLTSAQARKRAAMTATSTTSLDSPYNERRLYRRSSIDSQDEFDVASVASSATGGISNHSGSEMGGAGAMPYAEIRVISLARGETLVREGQKAPGLWFCIDGILEASMRERTELFSGSNEDEEKERGRRRGLFLIRPGGLAGYLAAMTGHVSFVTIRAKTDAQVGFLPKAALDRFVERYPNVLLTLSKRLITQLSPLVIHIDVALEWGSVNAGQVLYRQNDLSEAIYLVLNGRLRAIAERKGKPSAQQPNGGSLNGANGPSSSKPGNTAATGSQQPQSSPSSFEICGEYGRGESVGELEVLTGNRRPSTVHAIRDTEIAVMPKTLFDTLAIRHPEITIQISRIIATRSRRAALRPNAGIGLGGSGNFADSAVGGADSGKNNINLKTVAILPVSNMVPVAEFADRLRDALSLNGATVAQLTTATVIGKLGRHVFSRLGRLKLMSWLAEQEENFRIVLYVADGGVNSPWTQRCVRQADCILLVGLGDEEPTIGEYERLLISMKTTARKELVLLHNERYCIPGSTAAWLKNRLWVHAHHHLQMPLASPKMLTDANRLNTLTNLKNHFQRYYTRASGGLHGQAVKSPTIHTGLRSDFSRLARRLLSKSIGLVLGGGGARGISHIGVIKAFEEAGIPFDMVGGTSIGSLVSGLYAREDDHVSVMGRAKNFASKIVSKWRQICFFDTQIEDLWLSYFAVTTNITHSRMEIHRSGYIWRYVRASMSLSGYFPPLCDDGKMLLDGGYLNNLPADIMRGLGADVIIAVDVGLADDTSPVTYGDSLSGWWVLFSKWNPFISGMYGKIPPMADIQTRLAYVGSVKQLEDAKAMENCLYLQPPVAAFSTLQFESFKEIFEVGYKYGKEMVRKWEKDGTMAKKFGVIRENADDRRGGGRRASI
ncbi:phosphatidylcholine and lysophosphatidylcholine phospholipase [Irineochytrium annulatum]|nr:phosphatidylcholine and lysophosphatidylcholine phospholipase [Irineochytrium annulatum]